MIAPARDAELALGEVPAAIRRAGFVPAEMELRARGRYVELGGETAFRIRGWRTLLPIDLAAGAARPAEDVSLHAAVDWTSPTVRLRPMP